MNRIVSFIYSFLLAAVSLQAEDLCSISSVVATVGTAPNVETEPIKVGYPKTVEVGKNFRLSFTVDGNDAKDIQLSSSSDFEVVYGPSTSSQSSFQVINGEMTQSSSITFSYTLVSKSVGTKAIPVAVVKVGDKTVVSQPGLIEVVAEGELGNTGLAEKTATEVTGDSLASSAISDKDLFLTATFNKDKVEMGETLQLTLKLYTLVNVTQIGKTGILDIDDCYIGEAETSEEFTLATETYNERMYGTCVIRQISITPLKTGKFTVPEMEFEAVVIQRDRSLDPIEAFFNAGSGYKEVKKTIKSPAVEFEVVP